MRVVIQRVKKASCVVDQHTTGAIGQGLMLLVGFGKEDTEEKMDALVKKIVQLRIFEDADGKMNLSLRDVHGAILSISQFTLYASMKKSGNRPSFTDCLNYEEAKIAYDKFNQKLREQELDVQTGIFGADMMLDPICDGPVTILLEN
jgi:D-tyrosyl-tRNA(Tyr) deacylase